MSYLQFLYCAFSDIDVFCEYTYDWRSSIYKFDSIMYLSLVAFRLAIFGFFFDQNIISVLSKQFITSLRSARQVQNGLGGREAI